MASKVLELKQTSLAILVAGTLVAMTVLCILVQEWTKMGLVAIALALELVRRRLNLHSADIAYIFVIYALLCF
jgi:hypothetical protein